MIPSYLFIAVVLSVLACSCIMFLIHLKECIDQTRLPGGRYFGFNCDGCKGKRDKRGRYLLRCYIKPVIVDFMLHVGIFKPRK
jgi:hypothetical protein